MTIIKYYLFKIVIIIVWLLAIWLYKTLIEEANVALCESHDLFRVLFINGAIYGTKLIFDSHLKACHRNTDFCFKSR